MTAALEATRRLRPDQEIHSVSGTGLEQANRRERYACVVVQLRPQGRMPKTVALDASVPTLRLSDAPILNWQSPVASVLSDDRLAIDVWCSNEGPIGSVARVRYHAAYFHNVGTPPESGVKMEFKEFELDTSVYSVHATIDNRFLVKVRSHPLPVRQLGPLQVTWTVVYTDGNLRPYLTQASLIAAIPEGAIGPVALSERPSLDNTDAITRHSRYVALVQERPDSPVVVRST